MEVAMGMREKSTAFDGEEISDRQDDFRAEFTKFTTRRARRRTGMEVETPRERTLRFEGIPFQFMLSSLPRSYIAERELVETYQAESALEGDDQAGRALEEDDQAERAHQQQACSKTRRLQQRIRKVWDRLFGL